LLVAPAPAQTQPVSDPVAAIGGVWQIVHGQTGEILNDCDNGQRFTPSEDRRTVMLTFGDAPEQAPVIYDVLESLPGRARMVIQGETRLTESGLPVVWWAVFTSVDAFHWVRTDWPRGARTAYIWQRCNPPIS